MRTLKSVQRLINSRHAKFILKYLSHFAIFYKDIFGRN